MNEAICSLEKRITAMWAELGIDPSSRYAQASRETIADLLQYGNRRAAQKSDLA